MSGRGNRIVCLGEAMIELSARQGRWDVHYGGDTLNTALHLTRLGFDVAYLTALGGDPFAGSMRQAWGREGMDVSLVLTAPERTTGLYCIDTDETGERHFSYWRGESAARRLFLTSGIDRALESARKVRANGGKVAFDSNYRPRLWESADVARVWRDRAAAVSSFGMPSIDDERRLGSGTETAEMVRDHWLTWGCEEVIVKMGSAGAMLPDGTAAAPDAQLLALDTSGAGDAFDAGYLGARLRGLAPARAVADGQRLAGWTVMRRGAIPERDHAAPYAAMAAEAGAQESPAL